MDNIINTELKLVINKIFMNDGNDYMNINVKSLIMILYSMILNDLAVSDINKIKNIINIQLLQDNIPKNKICKQLFIQYQLSIPPDITYISCGSAPIRYNEFFPEHLVIKAEMGLTIKAINFDPMMNNTYFKPHKKAIDYLQLNFPDKEFKNILTDSIDFFYTEDRQIEIYNIINSFHSVNNWFITEIYKLSYANKKDFIVYLESECARNELFHNLITEFYNLKSDNINHTIIKLNPRGKRLTQDKIDIIEMNLEDGVPKLYVYDYSNSTDSSNLYPEFISTIYFPHQEAKEFYKELRKNK